MNRLLPLLITLAIAGAAALFFVGKRGVGTTVIVPVPAAQVLATPPPAEEEKPEEVKTPKGKPPAAKPFQRLDGCRLIPNRWNDGDSFHVMTADEREIIVRLYFVDTPEAETAYKDRIAEQAAYFGITPEQAVEVAHEAAAFTAKRLAGTFTVWTRWRSALGRSDLGRFYGIVLASDEDLNETLVHNGLARIYGTRTVLFDGRDSRTYLAHLAELEAEAKKARVGGWKY